MIRVLENYGLSGAVLEWFKSWLDQRKQQTNINGHVSAEVDINVGLPQGTPLLVSYSRFTSTPSQTYFSIVVLNCSRTIRFFGSSLVGET